MKYILSFIFLFSSVMLQSCNTQTADSKELKTIALQDSTLIVDVRTIEEYSDGHVAQSVNIPLNNIADSIPSLKKYKNLILVCRSGGRAGKAKAILNENGFSNVYNGGGWKSFDEIIKKECFK